MVVVEHDLREAEDNVERGADLMSHVLNERGLFLLALLCKKLCFCQFLNALFCLGVGLTDVVDVGEDGMLHLSKAVLQLSDVIVVAA